MKTRPVKPGSVQTVLPTGEAKVVAVDAMFDAIAPRYDLCNRVISLGLDVRWRKRTVMVLGLPSGSRVLDLACGTGDFSAELARHGLLPVGVDRSGGMLTAARARRASAALVQGDGLCLPVAHGSLDGIVCGFALRNFAALEPMLAECARVLRPGGRYAFLEVDTPPLAVMRLGHKVWFGKVVPVIGGLLSGGGSTPRSAAKAAYQYLPASVAYLPDPPALAEMLQAAGFTAVTRRPLSGGIAQLLTGTRS